MTQTEISPRLSYVRLPTSPAHALQPSSAPLIPRPSTPSLPSAQPLPGLSVENLSSHEEPSPILSPSPEPAQILSSPPLGEMNGDMQMSRGEFADEIRPEELQSSEEASVGRLSSMSLMAAVTASGELSYLFRRQGPVIVLGVFKSSSNPGYRSFLIFRAAMRNKLLTAPGDDVGSISDDTKGVFVAEVCRVGRDPVYWVRREACFAVGALAKVVPEEVVTAILLPLFEDLCRDTVWHVRHSALFALPAILTRLSAERRRTLALDILLPLARDDVATVRAGVLEALAEVIHTFHEDPEGPPDELIRLFLGIREDDDPLKDQELRRSPSPEPSPPMSWSDFVASVTTPKDLDIYEDPSRPLVCAFNYPAVALTVGRDRWPELRDLYQRLSHNPSFKVRRTLAASLGEMAKIIGPKYAKQDLLPVWWSSACSEEGEVRLKAMECVEVFMAQLAPQDRTEAIRGLEGEIWSVLKGWRERSGVMSAMGALVKSDGVESEVLRRLLKKGLVDSVAAVREAAISSLPSFVSAWSSRPMLLEEFWRDLHRLGTSSSFRERTTFVACYQEIILSNPQHAMFFSDIVLGILSELSCDRIVDVRIRLARLLGIIQEKATDLPDSVSRTILHLAEQLMYDDSHDVRAFAEPVAKRWPPQARIKISSDISKSTANFSRPPPLAPDPS
ncbi:hypothetical protein NM688_g6121 [Phlebia brevispora]|uniref:Uncharacterized protein n=1 Tax=Phlebia brevispora TaxID=194682 RepID=A0ACC1SJL7_9APHY|nr:hypothetical protein NM688_g6121 [Phlebia brevispora]